MSPQELRRRKLVKLTEMGTRAGLHRVSCPLFCAASLPVVFLTPCVVYRAGFEIAKCEAALTRCNEDEAQALELLCTSAV